jgi:phage recombination protein Bet
MSTEVAARRGLIVTMAERFGMEPAKVLDTLKATAFRGNVSNEQMMALLVVANQYELNPWTKEIYAFPDRNNGIVPVVGVDGWSRIINSHPEFDGMKFDQDADSCTCTIYRKDRAHPIQVTEWLEECRREGVGPWKSHPRRMLRHKAMIQCARLAFGFVGIFDQDEAERIAEATAQQAPVSRKPKTAAPRAIDAAPAEVIEGEPLNTEPAGVIAEVQP